MELEIIMLGEHELRQTDMPCFLSNSEKWKDMKVEGGLFRKRKGPVGRQKGEWGWMGVNMWSFFVQSDSASSLFHPCQAPARSLAVLSSIFTNSDPGGDRSCQSEEETETLRWPGLHSLPSLAVPGTEAQPRPPSSWPWPQHRFFFVPHFY
jgi:hypothetical protein